LASAGTGTRRPGLARLTEGGPPIFQ
jgi:hypothetical protein